MIFGELSDHLRGTLAACESLFAGYSPEDWGFRYGVAKWTRLEIVGHLIDSACNNHQRFVRALSQDSLEWPGYAQDDHVRVQAFAEADPQLTVTLFLAFNRHIAWIFDQFPVEKLQTRCAIDGAPAMSLEDLALDYVAHAEHHLRQILQERSGDVQWSGMPWPPADPNRQWPV